MNGDALGGLIWHAVVQEIHNGTVLVCLQVNDDWEAAEQFASFTELEQQEDPHVVERWLTKAEHEAALRNAEAQRAEFDLLIRRPESR